MNTVLIVAVLVFFWFPGIGGRSVLAGFSDNLVGKGKPPAASQEKEVLPTEPSVMEPVLAERGGYYTAGSFDVVGLRLGMRQEEAVAVIQGRKSILNGKPIAFEIVKERKHVVLVQGAVPRTWFLNLSNAKSVVAAFDLTEEVAKASSAAQDPTVQWFVAGGKVEVFIHQFPNVPNEARVSAITRLQRLAPPVHPDTIRTALVQKYGQPTIDDNASLIWLSDDAGRPIPSSEKGRFSCRGFIPPVGQGLNEYDYSLLALKECAGQLTVQLQGTPDSIMLIQTSLIHHQRLVEQREATMKAALGRFGLTPEQSKKAPAPQF